MTEYTDTTESEVTPERSDTLTVSSNMIPNSDSLEPGAELIFKFIGKNDDGELEIAYATPAQEEPSLGDDLKNAVMMKGV